MLRDSYTHFSLGALAGKAHFYYLLLCNKIFNVQCIKKKQMASTLIMCWLHRSEAICFDISFPLAERLLLISFLFQHIFAILWLKKGNIISTPLINSRRRTTKRFDIWHAKKYSEWNGCVLRLMNRDLGNKSQAQVWTLWMV